jgi:SET domain-containing protein
MPKRKINEDKDFNSEGNSLTQTAQKSKSAQVYLARQTTRETRSRKDTANIKQEPQEKPAKNTATRKSKPRVATGHSVGAPTGATRPSIDVGTASFMQQIT